MAEGPGITSVSDERSSLPFKKKGSAHPPARADEAPAIRYDGHLSAFLPTHLCLQRMTVTLCYSHKQGPAETGLAMS